MQQIALTVVSFGVVLGLVTFRALRRSGSGAGLSDIGAAVAAVGGPIVIGLFRLGQVGPYLVGFAAGFFVYFLLYILTSDNKREELRIGSDS